MRISLILLSLGVFCLFMSLGMRLGKWEHRINLEKEIVRQCDELGKVDWRGLGFEEQLPVECLE